LKRERKVTRKKIVIGKGSLEREAIATEELGQREKAMAGRKV